MDSLAFPCPSCSGINRVAPTRLSQGPKCGRCKALLDTSGLPVDVDDDALSRLVRASPVPVLVDFWAPWCGPCRMVAPHLEKLGQEHAGRLIIAKVNTDVHKRTAGELRVKGIPTLAVYQGGVLKKSEAGARMGAELAAFVAPYL